jgi:hypothetical protein
LTIGWKIAIFAFKTQERMKNRIFTLAAALSCLWLTGCESVQNVSLTARLWHNPDYIVPAPDPKLALFQTPRGILAQYDEMNENSGEVHQRSYLVEANLDRIKKRQRPKFILPGKLNPKTPIPILPRPSVGDSRPDVYAIYSSNFGSFTISRHGREVLGPCELPVFKRRGETAGQVALTPLAAAGDASAITSGGGGVIYSH